MAMSLSSFTPQFDGLCISIFTPRIVLPIFGVKSFRGNFNPQAYIAPANGQIRIIICCARPNSRTRSAVEEQFAANARDQRDLQGCYDQSFIKRLHACAVLTFAINLRRVFSMNQPTRRNNMPPPMRLAERPSLSINSSTEKTRNCQLQPHN